MGQGFHEVVVKTKNKFYEMRGTLTHLSSMSSNTIETRPITKSPRST